MNKVDERIKKQFLTWAAFSRLLGKNPSNFKRTVYSNVKKLNSWLKPLSLELTVKELSEDDLPNHPTKK